MGGRFASAAAVVLLTSAATPAASRAARHYCGDIGGEGITPANITSVNAVCRTARRIANTVGKVPSYGGCTTYTDRLRLTKPCVRYGYDCHVVGRFGYDRGGIKVRCRRGGKTIRFDMQ
jgi:hypothetical protein